MSNKRSVTERPKTGLKVEVRNGDFNGALRRFKKKVSQDGILMEVKERQHYTKPSEKRKKAKAAGRARHLKEQSRLKREFGI